MPVEVNRSNESQSLILFEVTASSTNGDSLADDHQKSLRLLVSRSSLEVTLAVPFLFASALADDGQMLFAVGMDAAMPLAWVGSLSCGRIFPSIDDGDLPL